MSEIPLEVRRTVASISTKKELDQNRGSISRVSPDAGVRTHERRPTGEGIMPLPPDGLLWSVGGSSLEVFPVVADAWDQAIARYLQPSWRSDAVAGETCEAFSATPLSRDTSVLM